MTPLRIAALGFTAASFLFAEPASAFVRTPIPPTPAVLIKIQAPSSGSHAGRSDAQEG